MRVQVPDHFSRSLAMLPERRKETRDVWHNGHHMQVNETVNALTGSVRWTFSGGKYGPLTIWEPSKTLSTERRMREQFDAYVTRTKGA